MFPLNSFSCWVIPLLSYINAHVRTHHFSISLYCTLSLANAWSRYQTRRTQFGEKRNKNINNNSHETLRESCPQVIVVPTFTRACADCLLVRLLVRLTSKHDRNTPRKSDVMLMCRVRTDKPFDCAVEDRWLEHRQRQVRFWLKADSPDPCPPC